jgi:hypothetical protein
MSRNLKPLVFYQMIVVDPSGSGSGTNQLFLSHALSFLKDQFSHWLTQATICESTAQNQLFQSYSNTEETPKKSECAELCLRSFVSYPIRDACIDLGQRWLVGSSLSYHDILPLVLNDAGQFPIQQFIPFSVKILNAYQPQKGCSLREWTKRLVRQHQEIKKILEEYDIKIRSNWAVLNKARIKDLESSRDQEILSSYHKVYKRDRINARSRKGTGRCPDPSPQQICEMLENLANQSIYIDEEALMSELRNLAQYLRNLSLSGGKMISLNDHSIWHGKDQDIEDERSKLDIEHQVLDEQKQFINHQFALCLDAGIEQALNNLIAHVKKGRRSHLTQKITSILNMVYVEKMSLNQIASELHLDQSLLSRTITPVKLMQSARQETSSRLIETLLTKAKQENWMEFPIRPNTLDSIITAVEEYIDDEAFNKAYAELKAGKNREFDSLYAERLRVVLSQRQHPQ